jgi:hypothetical protein
MKSNEPFAVRFFGSVQCKKLQSKAREECENAWASKQNDIF